MSTFLKIYQSSIGKKIIVALTGVCLCAYLIVHVAGNLLLFRSDNGAAFDAYAEILPSLLIIRIIEIVLFAIFLLHGITGVYLWILNKRARPVKYDVNKPHENSTVFSRSMFVTGSIVFIFLVIHMKTFWVAARFYHEQNPSMYAVVRNAFADPVYSVFYVLAMGLLASHLLHGFQSAFQTFGLKNKQYTPLIEFVGVLFWLFIPALFAAMPIYFLLFS